MYSIEKLEIILKELSLKYEEEVTMNFMGSIYNDLNTKYKDKFEDSNAQKAFLNILFT